MDVMQALVLAYLEPQRRYHTTEHLGECLLLLEQHLHEAVEPAEVEMALWFHDAVYDVQAHDNEARSAAWAERALSQAGVPAARIRRVVMHIMATCHAVVPQVGDQALLVDVDLAILGASPERFAAFETQVRQEYAWVPVPVYQETRCVVLRGFLDRPSIYLTPSIRQALEARARDNLAQSIERLSVPVQSLPMGGRSR